MGVRDMDDKSNKPNSQKKSRYIRWEVRVILLVALLIAFITFSGVWHLSSFQSMTGYTWGVYSHTDDWQGVNEQYNNMAASFQKGTTQYTYNIAGLTIGINKNMVSSQDKDTYMKAVLDMYTSDLYHLGDLNGIKGAIHTVAGYDTHNLYGALTLIFAVAALFVIWYMYKNATLSDFLKQTGLSFVIAGIITFAMLWLTFILLVDNWIATNETIYKEGLPIIAQMIKEWYSIYMVAIVVIGLLIMIPSLLGLVAKGKEKKQVASAESGENAAK